MEREIVCGYILTLHTTVHSPIRVRAINGDNGWQDYNDMCAGLHLIFSYLKINKSYCFILVQFIKHETFKSSKRVNPKFWSVWSLLLCFIPIGWGEFVQDKGDDYLVWISLFSCQIAFITTILNFFERVLKMVWDNFWVIHLGLYVPCSRGLKKVVVAVILSCWSTIITVSLVSRSQTDWLIFYAMV